MTVKYASLLYLNCGFEIDRKIKCFLHLKLVCKNDKHQHLYKCVSIVITKSLLKKIIPNYD